MVGIICPPGWDRVNCLAKIWGAKAGAFDSPGKKAIFKGELEVFYLKYDLDRNKNVKKSREILVGKNLNATSEQLKR